MASSYRRLDRIEEKWLMHPHESHSQSSLDELDGLHDISSISENKADRSCQCVIEAVDRLARSRWIWAVHLTLLLFSSSMLVLSFRPSTSTLQHVRQFAAWSPAAESVKYDRVRYNVSTTGNRFVGASPEVDEAWREISYDMGDQWIAPADLGNLDMPVTSLKVDHPTTGEEGYRVGMEVFHQLHCINLLRRVTYKEYYEPLGGEFSHGPEALQMHTDHCLEILRLNTQCNADVGVFTFYMVEGDPLAWPQLNSKHTCRNFDEVLAWAHEHSVGNMEVLA